MLGVGLGLSRGAGSLLVPSFAEVPSFAWDGTVVATIAASGATLTLLDDAAGRFALDGSSIVAAGSAGLNYLDAATHDVVVGVDGDPRTMRVTVLPPWMAAGTGLFPPQFETPAATATTKSVATRVPIWINGHGARKLRVFYPNFIAWNDGRAEPEEPGSSDLTIDGAALLVEGVHYPILFGGQPGVLVPAGTVGVWGEVSVKIRPRSKIFAITLCSVAQGATRPGPYRPDQLGSDYGGAYSAAPNPGYLTGASVLPSGGVSGAGGQALNCYGPSAIVEQGCWDGRDAFELLGDSIATAGWPVLMARESERSAAMGIINLSLSGSNAANTTSIEPIGSSHYWRYQMVRSLPNRPYTRVLSEMGTSDKHPDLAIWQARMAAWWAMLKAEEGFARDVPLDQSTWGPRSQSAGNWRWTNYDQMTFNEVQDGPGLTAVRWQMVDYLRTVPEPVDHLLDVTPSFVGPDPYGDRWIIPLATTLLADAAIGATTVKLAAPVPLPRGATAATVVFEGGAANWEQRNASLSVADGSGGYDVTLTSALTKAHLAGTTMHMVPTTDGTHPVGNLAISIAGDQVDAVKRDPNGIYMPERLGLAFKTPALLDAMDPGGVYLPGVGRISGRTSDLVDLMQAAGEAPTDERIETVDVAMRALFAKGILDRLDALHFLFAHGRNSSLLNWCDPSRFNLAVVGVPVFTVDAGWTQSVTGDRLNGLNPSDPAVQRYSRDDASVFIAPTVSGLGSNVVEATASPSLVVYRHNGNKIFRLNDGGADQATGTAGTAGFYSLERNGDRKRIYRELAINRELTTPSTGLPAVPISLVAMQGIIPSFLAIGASFGDNDTMRAELKGVLTTYLAAIAAEA